MITRTEDDVLLSNAWYAKFDLDVYALGPFRFSKQVDEETARQDAASWAGCDADESELSVWPTND